MYIYKMALHYCLMQCASIAGDSARTAVGRSTTLARESGTRFLVN